MSDKLVRKVIKVAFHRNGSMGEPFHVVLFESGGHLKKHRTRMIGIVFDDQCFCAVLDVDQLNEGTIEFMKNSWRGDNFEPELRTAITKYERERGEVVS